MWEPRNFWPIIRRMNMWYIDLFGKSDGKKEGILLPLLLKWMIEDFVIEKYYSIEMKVEVLKEKLLKRLGK
jgi:hypothetical protein